jgi:hypothetical protein
MHIHHSHPSLMLAVAGQRCSGSLLHRRTGHHATICSVDANARGSAGQKGIARTKNAWSGFATPLPQLISTSKTSTLSKSDPCLLRRTHRGLFVWRAISMQRWLCCCAPPNGCSVRQLSGWLRFSRGRTTVARLGRQAVPFPLNCNPGWWALRNCFGMCACNV